jgi:toxin ParE1/3/4
MQVRWTPAAVADLQRISDYLREHHPHYRQPTLLKLYESVCALKKWPQRGRIGRVEGTREFLFSPLPYIVVYRLTGRVLKYCAFTTPRRIDPNGKAVDKVCG